MLRLHTSNAITPSRAKGGVTGAGQGAKGGGGNRGGAAAHTGGDGVRAKKVNLTVFALSSVLQQLRELS